MPAEYEIVASIHVGNVYREEYIAKSPSCSVFNTFDEAFISFCLNVVRGYSVNYNNLNAYREAHFSSFLFISDTAPHFSLSIIHHEGSNTRELISNEQTDEAYECNNLLICIHDISKNERKMIESHHVEIEHDSVGDYFELYPMYDLVYDILDSTDINTEPDLNNFCCLLYEYLLKKRLITNEIIPSEEGFFCPGNASAIECFNKWGPFYGYDPSESELFISNLVAYEHGFVLEFRE